MCGISGIIHFGRIQDAPARVRSSIDQISHRGPDGTGFWHNQDVSFGFTRLSIVDLEHGIQPMSNEDGQVMVIFNGEIYNHRELRKELEKKGHYFKTDHSDTEVIVHGYEEWGNELPLRLNGMFAFAVWDNSKRSVFLARDRYGIKPLYIAKTRENSWVFSSEIRGIFGSNLIEKEATSDGVLEYFSLQNFWDGRTPFKGIRLFQPASYEIITPSSITQKIYWDYNFSRNSSLSIEHSSQRHLEILSQAIQLQADTDVPISSYLSGGIDSTAITAIAKNLTTFQRSYSCIFDLEKVGDDIIVDEREYSRAAAEYFNVARIEHELPQDILINSLDKTINALEYPRMGMAYVNYLISERVSEDNKVVLSGMGGDELHGGYLGRYQVIQKLLLNNNISFFDKFFRRNKSKLAEALIPYFNMLNFPVPERELSQAFTPEFLRSINSFSANQVITDKIMSAPYEDTWDILMYVDAKTYMHGLLVLEDKLSMIHSLETRVPLLDNDLVDFVSELPWNHLCDGKTGKIVFRESVKSIVPPSIYDKPKMGFGPPDASWYRGTLKEWISTELSKERIAKRGIFKPEYVLRKLEEHYTGQYNHVALIWSFLSFESWCRIHNVFGGNLSSPVN